jgi:undecaprenyl-phosphate galactose phosphotransferase
MSLVGPRPLIMDEMKFSPSWRDTRLKVKPGITGLWQIQGRSEAPFHDWIRYDVFYVKNQSLWMDIKIVFKTIKVVLKKSGAY